MNFRVIFLVIVKIIVFAKLVSCNNISRSVDSILGWIHDKNQLSPDVYFGLSIAKGILSSPNIFYNASFIDDLLKLKENWKSGELVGGNIYTEIVFDNIELNGLKLNRKMRIEMLFTDTLYIPTLDSYLNDIDDGQPSRFQSDICLAQTLSTKSCVISAQCMDFLYSEDTSKGYHKTHQVLLALMLQRNNCLAKLKSNVSLQFVLKRLCSSVLREVLIIHQFDFPEFLRDLILEQVLFCGLAGFAEFFNESLLTRILSWQTKIGCFSSISSNSLKCSNHMTGLGTALLSLLLEINK